MICIDIFKLWNQFPMSALLFSGFDCGAIARSELEATLGI
jgi:hypothetical protein